MNDDPRGPSAADDEALAPRLRIVGVEAVDTITPVKVTKSD